jgi:hypothetical protein
MLLSLSHDVNIVYSCIVNMYCCNLIWYINIVLRKVTRNKDRFVSTNVFLILVISKAIQKHACVLRREIYYL